MSTIQESVAVLCGWEDNRGPGIALVMHNRLRAISAVELDSLRKADKQKRPAYSHHVLYKLLYIA